MSLPTWLNWADRQDWGRRGPAFRNDPIKLVLHSTEGSSWPSYSGGAVQPHLTIKHRGDGRGFEVRQHQPLNVGARALWDSPAAPVNCMAAIQVEIIGSCDRSYARKYGLLFLPDAGDGFLRDLGEFIIRLQRECGFVLQVTSKPWPDTNAAYPGAPQRMSLRQFERFHGICGHTHVPANGHWDPGTTDVRRALKLAGGKAATGGGAPSPYPSYGLSRAEIRSIQRVVGVKADGSYGPKTKAAVAAYQRRLGVKADGIWGPRTQAAYDAAKDKPSRGKHRKPAKFPLPKGHAYAVNDYTNWTHSGVRRRDRANIRKIQRKVNVKADGRFGPITKAAVERFQRRHHLKADGEVGPTTWKAMF